MSSSRKCGKCHPGLFDQPKKHEVPGAVLTTQHLTSFVSFRALQVGLFANCPGLQVSRARSRTKQGAGRGLTVFRACDNAGGEFDHSPAYRILESPGSVIWFDVDFACVAPQDVGGLGHG